MPRRQSSSRLPSVVPIRPKATASTAASIATVSAITSLAPKPATLPNTATPSTFPTPASVTAPIDLWVQQFQQLQQMHYVRQHQLLSSTLLCNMQGSKQSINQVGIRNLPGRHGISSGRSDSPSSSSSSSSSEKGEKNPVYPSPLIKDDSHVDSDSDDQDAQSSDPLKPTASDLKKMTSKERRQLRNKLSARNFRVRRKEYIGTLENQVKEARREAADLHRRLIQSELNCQFLRQELETARFSQSLFTSGQMSREQANLLASLLHPNTESFPCSSTMDGTTIPVISGSSTISSSTPHRAQFTTDLQQQQQQQPAISRATATATATASWVNNKSNSNNNSLPLNGTMDLLPPLPTDSDQSPESQSSLQPFIPFDGDWSFLINRVEVPEAAVNPKDYSSTDTTHTDLLLARYEAERMDQEVDEQMRQELRAHVERRLAQTYLIMPKDELTGTSSFNQSSSNQDELLALQTLVYMLMLHLTRSLFEAATLSKSDLVTMFKTMDRPLRARMMADQAQDRHKQCGIESKFSIWRESWIRKHWPSFYNNRRRLSELFRMSGEQEDEKETGGATIKKDDGVMNEDVVETARKMEEGVAGKMVEVPKVSFFVRHCLPTMFKCQEILDRERLEDEARTEQRAILESSKAFQALRKVAV
ncbi:hypothetical protein BGX28_010435 [Mortierella sp. GBA30]|nr:hypothetical protein BGX28_010435 [Mortierella sp. GBA30]